MIGNSLPELGFALSTIFLLRSIPIAATLYSASLLFSAKRSLPWMLEYWLFAEALFHICVYVPRQRSLQKAAIHPQLNSPALRRALWKKCHAYLPDPEKFTAGWFLASSTLGIKRDNVVDWLSWALFATDHREYVRNSAMAEELEEYIKMLEVIIDREIEPGRNSSVKAMRLTLDPVMMLPRPIIWYFVVAILDCITYTSLYVSGFRHYTPSLQTTLFPPRPLTLLSGWSVAQNLPYWYRPHRSSTKLPIVMLHGIGIGLWPYVPFFADLNRRDPDVGILALEILPISMRITDQMLSRAEFINQLTHILDLHDIAEFVLVAHSYGSVLTTHILRSALGPRVESILLVDPCSILLHHPDVSYNFVYRKPKTASHWLMWYFASRDMGISHTLSRCFFWSDNILWKEDFEGRRVGIVLSGVDQIVGAREVWRYLTGLKTEPSTVWKDDKGELSVLWTPELDHGQVFHTGKRRKPLIELVHEFVKGRHVFS